MIDMSTISPGRHARDRRRCGERGIGDARRARLAAATSARARRRCRSWSAAATRTSRARGRSSRRSGKTIVHVGAVGAGPGRQGVQPDRRRAHDRGRLRGARARLEGRRRPGDDHRGARPAAWRPTRSWRSAGATSSSTTSRPASGSTCTTRTSGSRSQTAREYGVALPNTAAVDQMLAGAARERPRRPRPLRAADPHRGPRPAHHRRVRRRDRLNRPHPTQGTAACRR